jgi:hypothetical protein
MRSVGPGRATDALDPLTAMRRRSLGPAAIHQHGRRAAMCYHSFKLGPPRLDSEQFRSAPKVPHASMRKHLRCQRATFRAFGDKRLFREVSKTGALEIPALERAFADRPIPLRLARSPK